MTFVILLGSWLTHVGSTVSILSECCNFSLSLIVSYKKVAVTRAQALLIVVGDPQVLSLDPLWRSFLNYIYNNGGWTGPGITWDPTAPVDEAGGYDTAIREAAKLDMSEFARRMGEMMLGDDNEEVEADAGVDRPWREVE